MSYAILEAEVAGLKGQQSYRATRTAFKTLDTNLELTRSATIAQFWRGQQKSLHRLITVKHETGGPTVDCAFVPECLHLPSV
jgi:hypothetical protein